MNQVARAPLAIATTRAVRKRLVWLYVFFGPFAVLAVLQVVHGWDRGDERRDMAIYMLLIAAFLAVAPLLLFAGCGRWVARMDERGVTLRNGKTLPWSDYQRIEAVKNRKLRMVNHYELVFSTGKAMIPHLMAENYGEVMQVVRCFEDGGNPFVAG